MKGNKIWSLFTVWSLFRGGPNNTGLTVYENTCNTTATISTVVSLFPLNSKFLCFNLY